MSILNNISNLTNINYSGNSINSINSTNKCSSFNLNNGRVPIKIPSSNELFKLYDKIPIDECVSLRSATQGLWSETQLSKLFFSSENIQILQNGIRAQLYFLSNQQYLIGPQDCDTLKIIMRSIFLQYSSNKPTAITQQISDLNKMVINYCVQQLYSEVQGYVKYIDDVSTLVVPLAHPIQATNNDKLLEFKSWF